MAYDTTITHGLLDLAEKIARYYGHNVATRQDADPKYNLLPIDDELGKLTNNLKYLLIKYLANEKSRAYEQGKEDLRKELQILLGIVND